MFKIITVLMLVLSSASVSADFYVGGNIGYSWGSLESIDELGQNQFVDENPFYHFTPDDDYSSMATGLFIGYPVLPWLDVELDYSRMTNGSIGVHAWILGDEETPDQKVGFTQSSVDIDRTSFSAIASYAVEKEFDIFARLGYGSSSASYRYKSDGVFTDPDTNIFHESEDGHLIGLGVKFHNEHYYVRLEAQRDFTGIENMGAHMDSLIFGFGYRL